MGLRLALVTDIHLGPNTGNVYGDRALEFFDGFAAAAAAEHPDLVIDLGDRLTEQDRQSDLSNLIELAHRFRRLPAPRHHLTGNHDLLPKLEQETILEANLSSHALELGGWQLIFIETFDGTIGGAVTPDTIPWLERELAGSNAPCAVFSHQPLHGQAMTGNPYFESAYAEHACAKNAESVRTVLERVNNERPGKVRLCVNGHAHWTDTTQVAGIPYVTVPSLSESIMTDNQPAQAWTLLELGSEIRFQIHGVKPLVLEFGEVRSRRSLISRGR